MYAKRYLIVTDSTYLSEPFTGGTYTLLTNDLIGRLTWEVRYRIDVVGLLVSETYNQAASDEYKRD